MYKRRVIFRADGNSQIGLGHVVRALALAAMLRDEFECVFAIQAPSKELQQQIREVCDGLIVLPLCAISEDRYIHELDAYLSEEEIVVLDGYNFGTNYQESIKSRGATLVCIDDIHAYRFVADAVINQAGGVREDAYQAAPATNLYLGPAFALLRPPFLAAANQARDFPDGTLRLLLNMGGADPRNLTLQLAKELQSLGPELQVDILVGSAYRHQVELQAWLHNHPNFILHHNLTAKQMCNLMRRSAVAVTSASGVAYEYAAVGGLLFVMQTADNQQALYTYLLSSGVAKEYSELYALLRSGALQETFQEQVAIQRQSFDGQSGTRFRQLFRRLSLRASLRLRRVTANDLALLHTWANDPQVRQNSFNPKPISLEDHTRWFDTVLSDKQTLLYMAEVDGKPAAHIRFNVAEGTATISYLISADFRGKGLGHVVLQKGIEKLKADFPAAKAVEGLVKQENIASVRAFEKAGFSNGAAHEKHPDACRFTYQLK